MDKWVYFITGLMYMLPLIAIFKLRVDLRSKIIKIGIIGSFVGVLSEIFYFRDYWAPPNIFGGYSQISIEDALFGFAFLALCVVLYPFLSNKQYSNKTEFNKKFIAIFVFSMVVALILGQIFGINSIIISIMLPLPFILFILFKRRDLVGAPIVTMLAFTVLCFLIYPIIFSISPEYTSNYFLMYDDRYYFEFNKIPITEYLFYVSGGALFSILLPYITGASFVDNDNNKKA